MAAKKAASKKTKRAVKKPVRKTPARAAAPVTVEIPPIDYKGTRTLAFDIGGSGLKCSLLDEKGNMLTPRVRVPTPKPCPPRLLLEKFKELTAQLPAYDRISVGFPGVIRHGRVMTAVNLGGEIWRNFDLQSALNKLTGKPVVVINDADMQGLGAIKGKGVEMVITLGTGIGSALFEDGRLAPHLELGHAPFRDGQTFEEQLGNKAFEEVGLQRWNKRLRKAIGYWFTLTHYDKLYLGGGNTEHIRFKLPANIEIVSNTFGIRGGIWVWRDTNLRDGIQK
jgi:polyphosphate glucokinase